MKIRTRVDKYCDAAARYTSEFELRDFKVTDRSVIFIDISCLAPTRSAAIKDMRTTLEVVIKHMQEALK